MSRMRRVLEKSFLVMMVVGSLTTWGTPALAYVVDVLISIPVASSEGDALEDAVRAAVNDVLDHAIAFVPTVVGVLDARVVGNHIYILLLFADDDGAAIMKRLTDAGAYEL